MPISAASKTVQLMVKKGGTFAGIYLLFQFCYVTFFVTPLSPVVYFPVQNITLNPLATSEVCLSVVMIGLVLILQPYKKNCPQHY